MNLAEHSVPVKTAGGGGNGPVISFLFYGGMTLSVAHKEENFSEEMEGKSMLTKS